MSDHSPSWMTTGAPNPHKAGDLPGFVSVGAPTQQHKITIHDHLWTDAKGNTQLLSEMELDHLIRLGRFLRRHPVVFIRRQRNQALAYWCYAQDKDFGSDGEDELEALDNLLQIKGDTDEWRALRHDAWLRHLMVSNFYRELITLVGTRTIEGEQLTTHRYPGQPSPLAAALRP